MTPSNSLRDGVYCHCYPVFNCEPAVADVEGPDGWRPTCDRCMQIAWKLGLRVRMLQPRPSSVDVGGDVYEIAADRLDLPTGFKWEFHTYEDGGGSVWWDGNGTQRSSTTTPTVMKRAVGPWQVHRERTVING